MDKKELGLFIKKRRQDLNLSQQDLAIMLDITTQAISRWENGLSYPNFVLLGDLAKILNISIDNLLTLNIHTESNTQKNLFNQSTFGPNINRYLKSLKLTQQDLENKINISQASISNIINGKTFPTIPQFIQLCELFNVSYEDLYYSKFQKHIKIKKYKFFPIIPLLFCITMIPISVHILKNDQPKSPQEYYPIIEFYDSNNNLLSSKKYKHNSKITQPSYTPVLGFNKEIKDATFSTIYKENKNPYELTLKVMFEDQSVKNYYFDKYSDFNMYKLKNNNEYCYKLTHTNNDDFNINNIYKNYYEVNAYTKPNKVHTINFSSLDLTPLSIKTCETLNDLPYFFSENFIVKEYKYKDKIIRKNDIYSFEESITLSPITLNQTTIVNNEGYITYLSSNEEEIIIPSSINGIEIKGILSDSIHLNNNNKKITFLNKNSISFKNVFYNKSLIKNIKEIFIENINIKKNSYLGNIDYLDKLTVGCNYEFLSLNRYLLKTLSSSPDFKISKLEYYSDVYSGCSFQSLNVDEVYCLDEEYAYIYEQMFSNCSLRKIYFKGSILTNDNDFLIEERAFSNCRNLENFDFPNKTHLKGTSQFYNCYNLKNIDFYGAINSITNYMFYNTSLQKIICNYTVDVIYNNAFINTNIKEIEIATLNKIEDYIYFPSSLKNLYIGAKHKTPFIIREHNDLTIHYLDHTIYEKIDATYSICINCLHLHSTKEI